MKVSITEKKIEAVERMKLLKIYPETITQFWEDGYVSISEPPFGAFFWVNDEEKKLISELEQKHDALVYMVVRNYFQGLGKMDSFLFVSDCKDDEWETDRDDLKNWQAVAYVYNYSIPDLSEFNIIKLVLCPSRKKGQKNFSKKVYQPVESNL